MNGGGGGEGGLEAMEEEMEEAKERIALMWGYLPGASPQRSPLLSPVPVAMPRQSTAGDAWKDVCGGGCGFAMAISESGKLMTWGSTDDLGQSYLTSGKHEETPEAFPLPTETAIVKAAAGWAHCAAVTAYGEVYTWGWKECVPSGKATGDQSAGGLRLLEKDAPERQSSLLTDQVSPRSKSGEESTKRRRLSSSKQGSECSSGDENLSALPCLVTLGPGVRIMTVAAGGRHTLALSDTGQVWGWGYGGEGQLGLGSRIRMVSSPHPVPCIESVTYSKDKSQATTGGSISFEGQAYKAVGSMVKAIACGGRHSAVVTDTGALLTFGWGLYGQVGFSDLRRPVSNNARRLAAGTRRPTSGVRLSAPGIWRPTTPGCRQLVAGNARRPATSVRLPTSGARRSVPGVRRPLLGVRRLCARHPTSSTRHLVPNARCTRRSGGAVNDPEGIDAEDPIVGVDNAAELVAALVVPDGEHGVSGWRLMGKLAIMFSIASTETYELRKLAKALELMMCSMVHTPSTQCLRSSASWK
ncbi:hypothetical protein Taro_019308 [Colocasia esculenta]|uniref:Ultraviolet-B receptor UVR8 n=1 Tax=Colocasia esculenta TaxID=4460 RepID=A0A843UYU6_COLES|nr:hypothetical protein [Colocasia esculenta]